MLDSSCEVWWADLRQVPAQPPTLLDATERGRRDRLRLVADRERFTLGATLLRLVAAHHLGGPADRVRVDRTCAGCGRPHGRPRVAGVEVSVSHSGDLVAVAVTRSGPVGVDVEQVVDLDLDELRPSVLAADDPPVTDAAGLLRVWTRKEALLKATGDGLAVPMLSLAVDDGPRLLRYDGRPGLVATVQDLAPATGYAAAVAVLAPRQRVRELDATAVLSAHADRAAPAAQ